MGEKKISEFVEEIRVKNELSIRDLAKAYGISRNMAFRYVNGDMDKPTYNAACKFCRTFDVSKNDFVSDFYFEDKKIDFYFTNEENIKSRAIDFFTDDSELKFIQKYFDSIKEKTGVYDLVKTSWKDIVLNEYGIYHQATCRLKNGELMWIDSVLFLLGESAPILKQDFSAITSPINYIALLDSKYLPDECKNYVFLIPSKKCFNFIKKTPYDKNACKNNVIIYYVDRKTIKEKVVLFGKDFLEEK